MFVFVESALRVDSFWFLLGGVAALSRLLVLDLVAESHVAGFLGLRLDFRRVERSVFDKMVLGITQAQRHHVHV